MDTVVVAWVVEDVECAAAGACFGVCGGVDEVCDACMDDGHGAHQAGFQGDVEGAARHAMVAQLVAGGAQCHDFGVCAGVVAGDVVVPSFAEEGPFGADEHGADGDFIEFCCCTVGQGQGMAHPVDVFWQDGVWGCGSHVGFRWCRCGGVGRL